jgi:Mlc titration factor MtfA (ptsG expression regulator)
MGICITVGLALATCTAAGFVVTARRKARHAALMPAPFPESWSVILQKNLPPYPLLPAALRDPLHGYINIFLEDKTFEGCGGQAITDEVRVGSRGRPASWCCPGIVYAELSNYYQLEPREWS